MSTAEAKYRQLKVPELKELLSKKGLPVSGKKEELVARLLAAEDKKIESTNLPPKSNTIVTSGSTNATRTSNIENIINKDPMEPDVKNEDHDLFDKDLNLMTADITTGIDNEFYWEDDIPLTSPFSPSLSVTSIKDLSPEKVKTEMAEATKGSNNVTSVETKQSIETKKNPSSTEAKTSEVESSSSNPDSIVKPSGFTCKKIVFDDTQTTITSQPSSKGQTDLATELERRKKRAERFGVELSDADKKLQRAARFGTTIPNPLDAPLTAPRIPNRKPSIAEDEEKLKRRAERFGIDKAGSSSTSTTNTLSEEEKKRKRAERFGLNASPNSASTTNLSTTNLSTTAANSSSEEDKKRRRAERFAINSSGEPTNKKVKT